MGVKLTVTLSLPSASPLPSLQPLLSVGEKMKELSCAHRRYVYIFILWSAAGRIRFINLKQAAGRTKFCHGPDLARGPDFGHACLTYWPSLSGGPIFGILTQELGFDPKIGI